MEKLVHLIVGTKGEFVKLAPVFLELENRGIKVNLIHTKQHVHVAQEMKRVFSVRDADFVTHSHEKDFTGFFDVVRFLLQLPFDLLRAKKIFKGKKSIVILHGDTTTTLYGFLLAKLSGQKIAHIEAGLRSKDFLNPFPEELIRILVSRYSDFLFCPGKWACNNLKGARGKIIDTKTNTALDSIRFILKKKPFESKQKFVLALCHRTETLYSKKRLEFFVNVLEKVSKRFNVFAILHKPTEKKLEQFGLLEQLKKNPRIELSGYIDYDKMIGMIAKSEFVVSDGGGLQEETYFVDKPMFILRSKTERLFGLNETAFLSFFDEKRFDYFFANYKKFKRKEKLDGVSPSKIIVDNIVSILGHENS